MVVIDDWPSEVNNKKVHAVGASGKGNEPRVRTGTNQSYLEQPLEYDGPQNVWAVIKLGTLRDDGKSMLRE